jgi:hypothetical protein
MTEDEAKKKWCPMAHVSAIPHGDKISLFSNRDISLFVPPNSLDPLTNITSCIASDCMMWREDLTREEAEDGYRAANGHCGLGGKP